MCGLAVILCSDAADAPADPGELVGRMLELIGHRGPDDRQVRVLDGGGNGAVRAGAADGTPPSNGPDAAEPPWRLALGFNRLAIQDLSDAGRQPMSDPDERGVLVFNGEIYDFVEHRERLVADGLRLRSSGDAEVLLHMLVDLGTEVLSWVDGMFGLAFADLAGGRLVVARDRFGIKPLYAWRPPWGGWAFASEIKAFTVLPGWRAVLDREMAADYLRRGIIDHEPGRTMFAGVRSVEPGTAWVLPLGEGASRDAIEPQIEQWFEPEWLLGGYVGTRGLMRGMQFDEKADAEADADLAPEVAAAARSVFGVLDDAVARHMRSDVPVGSCLSGGVDSSAIVALAAPRAEGGTALRTFTASWMDDVQAIDEWPAAKATAEMAGADPERVCPDAAHVHEGLDRLVWVQDEPFASPSIVAQEAVFAAAREAGVVVMLDGQGADEQLAGYAPFRTALHASLLRRRHLRRLWASVRATRSVTGQSVVRQLLDATRAGFGPKTTAFLRRISGSAEPDPVGPALLDADRPDPFDRIPAMRRSRRDCSYTMLRRASLPMLLHWEDRNSMAHSIEARVPFVCEAMVALSTNLDDDVLIRDGRTKVALREAMRGRVPDAVLDDPRKVAFDTPERDWLDARRHPIVAEWLDDVAAHTAGPATDPSAGLIAPAAIDAARTAITSADTAPLAALRQAWRLICFGRWLRAFDVTW